MAAPVEVGAQGTVGSLVLREIEYFRRLDVAGGGKKSSKVSASGGGSARSSSGSGKKQKKNKGRGVGNGSFVPRMCSSAEVADSPIGGRRERPARVRYRPLGEEGDALPQED